MLRIPHWKNQEDLLHIPQNIDELLLSLPIGFEMEPRTIKHLTCYFDVFKWNISQYVYMHNICLIFLIKKITISYLFLKLAHRRFGVRASQIMEVVMTQFKIWTTNLSCIFCMPFSSLDKRQSGYLQRKEISAECIF